MEECICFPIVKWSQLGGSEDRSISIPCNTPFLAISTIAWVLQCPRWWCQVSMLRSHWTSDHYHFLSVLSSHISIPFPLSLTDYIGLLLSFPLIPYPLYRQSSLVLSSGWFLIILSVLWRLSHTIHWPTKQCCCRLGLCLLALVALPAQCRLQVYKLYQYLTWTLSLSFCTIETSEPKSKELHKLVDFPVSLLSAAA